MHACAEHQQQQESQTDVDPVKDDKRDQPTALGNAKSAASEINDTTIPLTAPEEGNSPVDEVQHCSHTAVITHAIVHNDIAFLCGLLGCRTAGRSAIILAHLDAFSYDLGLCSSLPSYWMLHLHRLHACRQHCCLLCYLPNEFGQHCNQCCQRHFSHAIDPRNQFTCSDLASQCLQEQAISQAATAGTAPQPAESPKDTSQASGVSYAAAAAKALSAEEAPEASAAPSVDQSAVPEGKQEAVKPENGSNNEADKQPAAEEDEQVSTMLVCLISAGLSSISAGFCYSYVCQFMCWFRVPRPQDCSKDAQSLSARTSIAAQYCSGSAVILQAVISGASVNAVAGRQMLSVIKADDR